MYFHHRWHSSSNDKKRNKLAEDAKEKDKKKEVVKSAVEERAAINFDMVWEMSRNPKRYKYLDYMHVVLNHLEDNRWLVSKKYLYFSLRDYCAKNGMNLLEIVPRTFYIAPGSGDDKGDLKLFQDYNGTSGPQPLPILSGSVGVDTATEPSTFIEVQDKSDENAQGVIWILKPASYANRGFGIKVVRGYEAAIDVTQRTGSADSTRSSDSAGSA